MSSPDSGHLDGGRSRFSLTRGLTVALLVLCLPTVLAVLSGDALTATLVYLLVCLDGVGLVVILATHIRTLQRAELLGSGYDTAVGSRE